MFELFIVFAIFLFILLMTRFHVPLNMAIFSGSILLAILVQTPPQLILLSVWGSVTDTATVRLVLIVLSILILSKIMKETGQMEKIVTSFLGICSDSRVVSSILPALIGILPMPGGALFSAPMVEQGIAGVTISAEHKTAINYWFRHIWEYWWPLYPGVILAVSLLKLPVVVFSMVMFPATLFTLFAGYFFLLRPLPHEKGNEEERMHWFQSGRFITQIFPIIIIVGVFIVSQIIGSIFEGTVAGKIFRESGILFGLLAGLISVMYQSTLHLRQFGKFLKNAQLSQMSFLIIAIMVFKGILVDQAIVLSVREALISYEIPIVLIAVLIPFLSGIITGIAIGFVGVSFPILVPLFSTYPYGEFVALAALAYVSGYLGMMLSPVHLCFVVTKDYFHADFVNSYKYLFKPVLTVAFLTGLLYAVAMIVLKT